MPNTDNNQTHETPLPRGEAYGELTLDEKKEFITSQNAVRLSLLKLGQMEVQKTTLLGQFHRAQRNVELAMKAAAARLGVPVESNFTVDNLMRVVSTQESVEGESTTG